MFYWNNRKDVKNKNEIITVLERVTPAGQIFEKFFNDEQMWGNRGRSQNREIAGRHTGDEHGSSWGSHREGWSLARPTECQGTGGVLVGVSDKCIPCQLLIPLLPADRQSGCFQVTVWRRALCEKKMLFWGQGSCCALETQSRWWGNSGFASQTRRGKFLKLSSFHSGNIYTETLQPRVKSLPFLICT